MSGPMVSLSTERPAIKALALPVPSDSNGQGIPVPFAGLGRPRCCLRWLDKWWLGDCFLGEIIMNKCRKKDRN